MSNDALIRFTAHTAVKASNAGLFTARGRWKHAERIIDTHELLFVREGKLHMHEEGVPYEISAGQTLILTAGRRHGGTDFSSDDLKFYYIHFTVQNGADRSVKEMVEVPQTTSIARPDRLTELFRRFLDDQESKNLDPVYANLLVALMLCEVARSEAFDKDVVTTATVLAQRAEGYIRTHFSEPISTSHIAHALDANPDYLGRAFRMSYGITPTEYVRKVRLRYARTLLMEGGMSVAQIARECGFEDPGYFRRVFRLEEGMAPLAYRKLYARAHINFT